MARTLVLGAGFGGITVATELAAALGEEHEVVLVDRGPQFVMGLRKLWAPVGIGSLEEGSRRRQTLERPGLRFLQRRIEVIDPAARRVEVDGESLTGDYLVVALGAEPRPDLIPGLAEHGHDVWSVAAVPALTAALGRFVGGRIAIVIAGAPYPCPPAPYECAMLIDDHLRERGLRERSQITVATLQPMLLPNAGREGSAWLAEQLGARGIEFQVQRKLASVDTRRAVFADGELEFDLLVAVPPHRVPAVVRESGLTGEGDWVAVDASTLETAHERVFAIGDVTQIKLANGLPLPKAGVMAELEGKRVAAAIVADLRGGPPAAGFDGRGYCFLEMGKREATLIEGDFYASPEPRVTLGDVSADHARAKHRFEAERLELWFGG